MSLHPTRLFADVKMSLIPGCGHIAIGERRNCRPGVVWVLAKAASAAPRHNFSSTGIQTRCGLPSFLLAWRVSSHSLISQSLRKPYLQEVNDELEGRDACNYHMLY